VWEKGFGPVTVCGHPAAAVHRMRAAGDSPSSRREMMESTFNSSVMAAAAAAGRCGRSRGAGGDVREAGNERDSLCTHFTLYSSTGWLAVSGGGAAAVTRIWIRDRSQRELLFKVCTSCHSSYHLLTASGVASRGRQLVQSVAHHFSPN
jgi:hypothetical protein